MLTKGTSALAALYMVAALGGQAQSAGVHAGRFPAKPVRMLVGFAAGGAVDVQARVIAHRLGEAWRRR